MNLKYVFEIRAGLKKYKFIKTQLATENVLDGSYGSIYKGRSLNFDELREYVEGDELKDVDWKASARTRKLLVRQYIAEKKHSFMLVLDTDKRMLGDTKESGCSKAKAAIYAAGTFAYLVNLNGDYISSMYSAEGKIKATPFKTGVYNIENILSSYDKEVNKGNRTDINDELSYISNNLKKKAILLLVTDFEHFSKIPQKTLSVIMARHELMVILISDADLKGKRVFDNSEGEYLPAFFSESRILKKQEDKRKAEIYKVADHMLECLGIAHIIVDGTNDIDMQIIKLLELKKNIKF